MRRKTVALALALLVLVSVLPPGLAADGAGKVVFESGPADNSGVFEVTVKIADMKFWGIQFALKYDPAVIQPVDAKGSAVGADNVNDAFVICESFLDAFAKGFEPEKGLLGGTTMVELFTNSDRLNDFGDFVVGAEEFATAKIRFKRLKDGPTGLDIATEAKGEPWQPILPEGVMAVSLEEDEFPVNVVFREADKPGSETSESFKPPASTEPTVPEKTAADLLAETVILQIGSHAAVVPGGGVAALYFGERMVTAYAHDNRTFVPVRFVGERLGATVDWDNDTQTVIVEKDGRKIEMAVGSTTYYINGEAKTLDAPAEFTPSTNGNSRTMVPIRFVSEALGYQVEWDQARNLVIIAPPSLGWDPAGKTEAQAMDQAVTNLLMYSNFV